MLRPIQTLCLIERFFQNQKRPYSAKYKKIGILQPIKLTKNTEKQLKRKRKNTEKMKTKYPGNVR